uniref:HTH cro/C1-type domain-containing protein n=1 Tax=viral metagenome TaxID=1070528 RepID=A0A6C0DAI8_9ZZZZ
MEHQDWKPVVFTKPSVGVKQIVKRQLTTTQNPSVKLDENDEVIKIKKVPSEISKLLTTARVSKKLTRKQLANQLNLKEDVITAIETGTAIYDGNQIAKIKRHLGIV